MKRMDVQKVALMYNVLDEKDGCIKNRCVIVQCTKNKKSCKTYKKCAHVHGTH